MITVPRFLSRRGSGRVRSRAAVTGLLLLPALAVGLPSAAAHTPGPAVPLATEASPVWVGEGNQTDPHLSGSLLAATELAGTESRIRYVDLADGSGGEIPNAGHRDALPDVSGTLIAFRRVRTDTADRSILVFDVAAPALGVREVSPDPGSRRSSPSIGGPTVAFVQFVDGSSTASEVCVADVTDLAAPAVCLTSDGMSSRDPAVSPDGGTVTWATCTTFGTGCDIYVAQRRADGTWSSPLQLTDSTGEEILPDTDGTVVTYTSNAAHPGTNDYDIWWERVDGSDEHMLVLTDAPGSIETNPKLSGGAISFERELPGSTEADLYLVRPDSGVLHRLTDTPADETLNALSVGPGGELRVAWAQPDGLTPGHNDIHALRGQLGSPAGPSYETCLLYDPTKAHRAGSTVPLRLQLCDIAGANLSAPGIGLTALGLVRLDGSASTTYADSSGNANPDSAFRYDADLAGYAFNLSTKGLSRGTWALQFVVDGSATVHQLRFDVR
jgi:hypothetical protein